MQSFKDFLTEISDKNRDLLDDRMDSLGENQGLEDLFKGVQRMVIPFADTKDNEIGKIKEGLTQWFQDRKKSSERDTVVVKFDWGAKEVTVTWKNPNAGKEVEDKKTRQKTVIPELNSQKMTIAKAIGKAGLGQRLLDWWTHFANDEMMTPGDRQKLAEDADKYSILISRHPIDILRMSDFENISSCHSPDGSYWYCAKQEALDGGATAYIVQTKDLEGVDLENDDVFKDSERDITSHELGYPLIPKPLTRLRIRRFHSKFKDTESGETFDFAVPEDGTYGMRHPSFVDRIVRWLRHEQEDLVKRNGLNKFLVKNFKLRGGKYRDSSDSTLFDQYFGDSRNAGQSNTTWEYEGQEFGGSQIEQYRKEIEQINAEYNGTRANNWKGIFKYAYTSYYEYDENDDEGRFDYTMSGGLNIVVENIFLQDEPDEDDIWSYRTSEKDGTLVGYLGSYNHDFYNVGSVNINYNNKKLEISISFDNQDEDYNHRGDDGLHPDAFRDWCEHVKSEYEDNYDEILELTKHWLIENGYTGSNAAMDLYEKINTNQIRFINFEIDEPVKDKDAENASIVFSLFANADVKLPNADMLNHRHGKYSFDLMSKMIKRLFSSLMKTRLKSSQKQMSLPFDPQDPAFKIQSNDDPNPKSQFDAKQKWFDFSPLPDPEYTNRFEMRQEGIPDVFISARGYTMKDGRLEVQVIYSFRTTDSEDTVQAALQNIMVYDHNWKDLVNQAEEIVSRATYVRQHGRNNYQTYQQNLQAQLLGAKPSLRTPNRQPGREPNDDKDPGFYTHPEQGDLPYYDYSTHMNAQYRKSMEAIDKKYGLDKK